MYIHHQSMNLYSSLIVSYALYVFLGVIVSPTIANAQPNLTLIAYDTDPSPDCGLLQCANLTVNTITPTGARFRLSVFWVVP